jgi:nucleoid-associated protein YgaU
VRVEPSGDSVIAGRAAPGAAVELLRDGVVHDRAVADASGQFAFVAPPLPTGPSQLSLRMPAADGTPVLSEQSVTVVVAPRRDESPVVALASPDRPTTILSAPAASPPSPAPSAAPAAPPAAAPSPTREAAARAPVRVEAVEAEDGGKLYVSGRAAPGTTVRLYLNETLVASGPATPEGRISFSIERGVAPGDYRVRLDEAEAGTGAVRSRAQVAFAMPAGTIAPPVPPAAPSATRPPAIPPLPPTTAEAARPASPELPAGPPSGPAPVGPASRPGEALTASAEPVTTARSAEPGLVVVPRVETATVSRGDSLWRISRRIYGSGVRYTVIYDANQEQIRDPNRIYPGQLFVLPGEGAPR